MNINTDGLGSVLPNRTKIAGDLFGHRHTCSVNTSVMTDDYWITKTPVRDNHSMTARYNFGTRSTCSDSILRDPMGYSDKSETKNEVDKTR